MTSLADLETAIDALLQPPLGPSNYLLAPHVASKAYEAYVFGLCLRAVRELGAVPVLKGITGPPTPFVFRGGPGQIYSSSKNYGYAEFTLGKATFEIHAGVEFLGTSGMAHELDVSVMRGEDARKARVPKGSDPEAASIVAAFECKFYIGGLDKSLARAFVGLMDDMGTNPRLSALCSNQDSNDIRMYLRPQRRPDPQLSLTPLKPDRESIFVGALKSVLNKIAGS